MGSWHDGGTHSPEPVLHAGPSMQFQRACMGAYGTLSLEWQLYSQDAERACRERGCRGGTYLAVLRGAVFASPRDQRPRSSRL